MDTQNSGWNLQKEKGCPQFHAVFTIYTLEFSDGCPQFHAVFTIYTQNISAIQELQRYLNLESEGYLDIDDLHYIIP